MADLMPLCATSEPCAEDIHLVLCPFAGGSASAFRSWRDLRPCGWQVWLAVYPGRDQRMNEACAASIDELADQVLMAIDTHQITQQQLVVAGHSMGAQVAYEVCVRLEQRGSAPLGLVLSGCHAPHLHGRRLISHLEDRAFLEQLVAIGGNAQELLNEPGLWPVFMPMLRADFKATESYWHPPPETGGTPATANAGVVDLRQRRPGGLAIGSRSMEMLAIRRRWAGSHRWRTLLCHSSPESLSGAHQTAF